MLPQVATAAPWATAPATAMNVAFTFAGLRALGLPDDVLASFPEAFRDGMAARAEQLGDRGPSAPVALGAGIRRGARARHASSPSTARTCAAALESVIGADAEARA